MYWLCGRRVPIPALLFLCVAGGSFLPVPACAESPIQAVTTDRDGIWIFPATGEGAFADGTFIFVGTQVEPWHLLRADLNGDGLQDVVSSNRYGPSVSVFLNNGSTFENPVSYSAGPKPYQSTAGDFDADGDQDLAVANPVDGGTLVLLFNRGDGTFAPGTELHLGDGTYAAACEDIDRDGVLDLAVVNRGSNEVVILLGEGGGTFAVEGRIAVSGGPKDIVFGRFNDDELPDMAVVSYEGAAVTVFVNDGGGVFDPGRSYAAGVLPRHLVAGDLNQDNLDDLVAAGGRGSEEIFVLYAEGDGRFSPAVAYHTGPRPNSVAVCDVDGDSWLDILAANWSLGNEALASVTVLGNDGTGEAFLWRQDFKPPQGFAKVTFVIAGRFSAPSFLRGDVTGDGQLNVSDPIVVLRFLFGLRTITCVDAADVDDDGTVNIADPIMLLAYLFSGGEAPAPPYPSPGADPTADSLTCTP